MLFWLLKILKKISHSKYFVQKFFILNFRLAELSNICGHISAQKSMEGEWCVAIQELCYSSISKSGYNHLIREINVVFNVLRIFKII